MTLNRCLAPTEQFSAWKIANQSTITSISKHLYLVLSLCRCETTQPAMTRHAHTPSDFFRFFQFDAACLGPWLRLRMVFWLSSDDQRALPLGRTEPRRRHRELTATHELEKKQKTKQKCHNLSQFVYLNLIS